MAIGTTVGSYLQRGQIEAHVSRLTAVRTQLQGYASKDGRAAEAMPLIDNVIASLQQEPFDTPTDVVMLADEDDTETFGDRDA